MHEWSIVQALLEEVERQARAHGAGAVHRLHLRIGALAGVEVPLLETAWEAFREGGRCAGAALVIERVPARFVCRRCGREPAEGAALACALCGAPARLESGDEIVLARLEMERAGPPAAQVSRAGEGA